MNAPCKNRFQTLILPLSIILFVNFPIPTESNIHDFNFEAFNIELLLPPVPLVAEPDENLSKDSSDVHFYLFSNLEDANAHKEIVYNDHDSLIDSGFAANHRTVFIIHGFRSNLSSDMPQTLKNAFLAANADRSIKLDTNIIVLSWGKLATPPPPLLTAQMYDQVIGNVPIVGQRLADFILFLREKNLVDFSDIHLIGHSLGAHVAGLAGHHVYHATGEKVSRITGLDPAGLNFYPPEPTKSLMKADANFVDVIHTNLGMLGDLTNDGHADFYPNGGSLQPGCYEEDTASSTTMGRCSHWYAYRLFAASIIKPFPACPCTNVRFSYPMGLCTATCDEPVMLGFNCLSTTRGEFYLVTSNPP